MNTNSSQNSAATTESASTAAPRRNVAKRLKDTVYKLRVAGGRTLTYVFRPRRRLSALLMTLLGSLFATISAYAQTLSANALPQGGNVANGAAAITTNGAAMKVTQTTQDMVVNWSSFNIGANASVQFAQPNSSSVALNRVVSTDPSLIFGSLTANGKVFLTNPAGVVFGQGAKVDVGGLVATTLSISDADFLAGRVSGKYTFSGQGAGKVEVQADAELKAAEAGYIALLAPKVINQGVITARLGTVALASGNKITLDRVGDGLLKVAVDEAAVNALASNQGLVQADGGLVYMGARSVGDVMATVVNNTGIVQARSIVEREGRIILTGGEQGITANSGTLDVSSATGHGGTVQVLGDKVGLFDGTRIDASGATGGGTVLVGGDFQGKNPDVQNAAMTYVGKDARIKADAAVNGDGGKVVVWSNEATRFAGNISARGGAAGGDGGSVEVSGHKLGYAGLVDTRAPQGKTGSLLLDPTDVTISTAATTSSFTFVGTTWSDDGTKASTSTLNVGDLTTQLGLSSVTVSTVSGGVGSGDISVANAISWANGNSLTLAAERNITTAASATITNTGAGGLNLYADGVVTLDAAVSLAGGTFKVAGTAGGATRANSFSASAAGSINTQPSTGKGGAVSIATTNDLDVYAVTTSAVVASGPVGSSGKDGGAVTLDSSSGTLTIHGAVNAKGSSGWGGAFNVTEAGGNGGLVTLSGNAVSIGESINTSFGSGVNGGASGTGGAVSVSATGGLSIASGKSIASGGGTITMTAASFDLAGTVNATAAGTVRIDSSVTAANPGGNPGQIALGASKPAGAAIYLDNTELSHITAGTFTIGGATSSSGSSGVADNNPSVVIDGLTSGATANIGTTTINRSTVQFTGTASQIHGNLNINATGQVVGNNSIDVQANVTVSGNIVLNANSDNSGGVGSGHDLIRIGNATTGRSLTSSGGSITFQDPAGAAEYDVYLYGGSTVSAKTGITFEGGNRFVASAGNGSAITINANNTGVGSGSLNVGDGVTVLSGGNALNITAADLDLNTTGAINSGAGKTTITSTHASGLTLVGAGGMGVSNGELTRITATGGLEFDTTMGGITVQGLSTANTANISGTLTLAPVSGQSVTFDTAASQLKSNLNLAINVAGAGGVDIGKNLTVGSSASGTPSGTGGLTITAAAGSTGTVTLGGTVTAGSGGVTIAAPQDVTITSALVTNGNIDIQANNNVDVQSDVRTTGASTTVSLWADKDATSGGDLTIGRNGLTDASVQSKAGQLSLQGYNVSIGENNKGLISTTSGNIVIAGTESIGALHALYIGDYGQLATSSGGNVYVMVTATPAPTSPRPHCLLQPRPVLARPTCWKQRSVR